VKVDTRIIYTIILTCILFVCSDCVFVILYVYMSKQWASAQQLFIASSILTVAGYLCNAVITGLFKDIPSKIWMCECMPIYNCC